ncbi:MAG: hypothetical protein BJ554DRAFT_6190, partial [Olpidium bornovanus]
SRPLPGGGGVFWRGALLPYAASHNREYPVTCSVPCPGAAPHEDHGRTARGLCLLLLRRAFCLLRHHWHQSRPPRLHTPRPPGASPVRMLFTGRDAARGPRGLHAEARATAEGKEDISGSQSLDSDGLLHNRVQRADTLKQAARKGDLAGAVSALRAMRRAGDEVGRETYYDFFAAILSCTSVGGTVHLEQEDRCAPVAPELTLAGRPAASASELYAMYARFNDTDGLRQVLYNVGLPREPAVARLVLLVVSDLSYPKTATKNPKPIGQNKFMPLFDNHERLQVIFAHHLLGKRRTRNEMLLELWEDAPGIDNEIPFHFLFEPGEHDDAGVLEEAASAAALFAEMEARGTPWTAPTIFGVIRRIKAAQERHPDTVVNDRLGASVADVLRRRESRRLLRKRYGWDLDCADSPEPVGSAPKDWPARLDYRLGLHEFATSLKRYLDTGACNWVKLRQVLLGLEPVEHMDRAVRDAEKGASPEKLAVAKLVLQIASLLEAKGTELTLAEKIQVLAARLLHDEFEMVIEAAKKELGDPDFRLSARRVDHDRLTNLYFRALISSGRWKAFKARHLEKQRGVLSVSALNGLHSAIRDRTYKIADSAVEYMRGRLLPGSALDYTDQTFVDVLKLWVHGDNPDRAEAVLSDMLRFGHRPPDWAYLEVAWSYLQNSRAQDAARMFYVFIYSGGRVTPKIAEAFLYAIQAALTGLDLFRRTLNWNVNPTTKSLAAVIAAAKRLDRVRTLEKLLQFAQLNGMQLTQYDYHNLVYMSAKMTNLPRAQHIMQQMLRENVVPLAVTHECMLQLIFAVDGVQEAFRYYVNQRGTGLFVPTHHTVFVVLMVARMAGAWDFVQHVMADLRAIGYDISPSDYTRMIKSVHNHRGNLDDVFGYVDMLRLYGARMDLTTARTLLWLCGVQACRKFPDPGAPAFGSPEAQNWDPPDDDSNVVRVTPAAVLAFMRRVFADLVREHVEIDNAVVTPMVLSLSANCHWRGLREVIELVDERGVTVSDDVRKLIENFRGSPLWDFGDIPADGEITGLAQDFGPLMLNHFGGEAVSAAQASSSPPCDPPGLDPPAAPELEFAPESPFMDTTADGNRGAGAPAAVSTSMWALSPPCGRPGLNSPATSKETASATPFLDTAVDSTRGAAADAAAAWEEGRWDVVDRAEDSAPADVHGNWLVASA